MNKNLKLSGSTGTVPMGTILTFALSSTNTPGGWLPCDGSTIPPQYQELITALGSNTTPNLCGRVLMGTGAPNNDSQTDGRTPNFPSTANWPLGYTGGEYVHTLLMAEIPSHSHNINGGNFGTHDRSFEGDPGDDAPFETSASNPFPGTDPAGGNSDGSTSGHLNMQPYYAINYIIFTGHNNN